MHRAVAVTCALLLCAVLAAGQATSGSNGSNEMDVQPQVG